MKKTALFLAMTAGIAFNTATLAAGFNERGEDFIASVQSDGGNSDQSITGTSQGFNERGVNYIAEVSTKSGTSRGKVYITLTGFNDRSFDSIN